MSRTKFTWLLGAALCVCTIWPQPRPAQAGTFTFQGLGDLPGGAFHSSASGVSADGSVVVGLGKSNFFEDQAFRWTSDGGMVGLGDLAGGAFESVAYGVSADGSVVVGKSTSASGFDREAFRWTAGTGMIGLGHLPLGGIESAARAVSADGSVVVGYSDSTSGFEAFRWTEETGMVGLGHIVTIPDWINDSYATGVSADGLVVVGYSTTDSYWEAFRWSAATGMVGLGNAPGTYGSVAYGVSGDGLTVVGQSNVVGGGQIAFLWTDSMGMVDLRDHLIANGATGLEGWTLFRAAAISADGATIVGWGTNPSGETEAWRATIAPAVVPEPSTWALLASGALPCILASAYRRRQRSTGHLT